MTYLSESGDNTTTLLRKIAANLSEYTGDITMLPESGDNDNTLLKKIVTATASL